MAKAAELGFKLSRPWGDSATYDVVIELKGRFVRVQVKSTMCKARGRKPHYAQGTFVANMRHISMRRYQHSDFDYLRDSQRCLVHHSVGGSNTEDRHPRPSRLF